MSVGRATHRDSSLKRVSSASLVTQIRPSPAVAIPIGSSGTRTFVNGEPVRAHRRLHDGDALRLGSTVIVFRNPGDRESRVTTPSAELRKVVELTDAQRRVLVALCRPFKDSAAFVTPPPNEQIARELFLSVDAIKKHMRSLFEKFEVQHLPQNEKRARLVERAFAGGFISERNL